MRSLIILGPYIILLKRDREGMSFNYMFKFIIIGDTGVGKSCLLLQFIDQKFREKYDTTIGVEFGSKTLEVSDRNIKLQIWDTAGQQSFKSITRGYYKSAVGAILVYDVTNRVSFDNILKWLEEARENGNPETVFTLVGNKCDLDANRQVTFQEGEFLAKEFNMAFLEVSAKTAFQVEDAFRKNCVLLMGKIDNGTIEFSKDVPGIKKGSMETDKPKNFQLGKEDGQAPKRKCCGG